MITQNMSQSDLEFFKLNGFLKVSNLFPDDSINLISNDVDTSDEIQNADGVIFDLSDGRKELRYLPRPHVVLPSFLKLVNSNVLSISSQLLNENVYFVGIDLHCRVAGSKHPTPPHQDSFLFCFEPGFESFLTCYISISDMSKNSARLRFIKGSHLNPTLDHKKCTIRGFSSVIEESSDLLSNEILENEEIISLKKGECVFFHAKTIHYTNQSNQSNPSTKSRMAAAIRIAGYNAKYSVERQKKYKEFVAYNREMTLKEGLTNSIPKPQHN